MVEVSARGLSSVNVTGDTGFAVTVWRNASPILLRDGVAIAYGTAMTRRLAFTFVFVASVYASGSANASSGEHRETHAGAPVQIGGHGVPTQTKAAPAAAAPIASATIVVQRGGGAVRAGVAVVRPTVDDGRISSSYRADGIEDNVAGCYRVFLYSGNADDINANGDDAVPSDDDSQAPAMTESDDAFWEPKLSTVDFSVFD